MYLDANGLIEQSNGDGGDKLQREGFWFLGNYFSGWMAIPGMAAYADALRILQNSQGQIIRDEILYTSPTDVSRDQVTPNIIACGFLGKTWWIQKIVSGLLSNFSRYPNGDIAFVQDYGRLVRALGLWYLSPLLYLCDLQMLVSVIIRIFAGFDPNNVGDDINTIADLAQAQHVYPTAVSFMARKLYKYLRPQGPLYPLQWYFRAETGANTEFIELWKPIVENF
jgi:hypothetical protein